MAGYRKKIVAFVVAVALCSGAPLVCFAQSVAAAPTEPLFDNSSSLFADDPNLSMRSADNFGTRQLFFKMMAAVLLVIILGVAAIYISKKLLPRITNLPGKEIRIIETVHLGPHKAVHLLKIANQWLLIGSTSESITKLADVTEALKGSKGRLGTPGALSEIDLSAQDTDNS